MVSARRRLGRLGCLLSLLVVVTEVYFGMNVVEVYVRFYRLRDAMVQEARFAGSRTDSAIVARLAATADSLGLPYEAARFRVRRESARIIIRTEYLEHVELPLHVREFRFAPKVIRAF